MLALVRVLPITLLFTSSCGDTPTPGPPSRSGAALAYDVRAATVVLFTGGSEEHTWEWDGTTWTERSPTLAPHHRREHAMVYDEQRERIVMHGGWWQESEDVTYYGCGDIWEWQGGEWEDRTPCETLQCELQDGCARPAGWLVYDVQRTRVAKVGEGGTWDWDGSSWTQSSIGDAAPIRQGEATAYDPVRNRLVMFGGYDYATDSVPVDTWEWDGTSWMQLVTATAPSPRMAAAMVYDAARGRIVLFGGGLEDTIPPVAAHDTWEWDGSTWTERTSSSSPPGREWPALAYDTGRERVVLFGGWDKSQPLDDTWEWDGTTWIER